MTDPATAGTADPRAEIRKRIVRHLNTDEWMNRHFGISCHAGDVADAVLELFESVSVETFPARAGGLPDVRQFVLRTVSEVQP